jgi:murein DD-endopeptidase MepM/ murein hydrolase activator NlpD
MFLVSACGAAADADGLDGDSPPALNTLSKAVLRAAPDSLVATLIAAPQPVKATDEQRHLVYELLLQNTGGTAVTVSRLDVSEPGRRAPLRRYAGRALAQILLGVARDGEAFSIPPGGVAVAFLDIALAGNGPLPRSLEHDFMGAGGERARPVSSATVPVLRDRPIRISPPLRGDDLVNLNGCCASAHTRALIGVAGELFLAQRFAIDFLQAEGLSSFAGDPTRNDSYFLYGANVRAVAPGRIIATRDGVAENTPTEPLPPADLETAPGNYVVQALDAGHFALYAHLQPGSLQVSPGQRIGRGQVLGLVGNSGNSTEPHLHFHVMDRPSPLAANGLPYVFDGFDLHGTVDLTSGQPVIVPTPPPLVRRNRLPLDLDLIAFP